MNVYTLNRMGRKQKLYVCSIIKGIVDHCQYMYMLDTKIMTIDLIFNVKRSRKLFTQTV